MPPTLTLSEEAILRVAPDDAAVQAGRDLLRKKSFANLGVSADGTWLLGECKGSGKKPYQVSVDLANETAPVGRCSCPSRKFPCKHCLGLMLAYVSAPTSFGKREPDEDLLAKRDKQTKRAEKKAEGTGKPRKVNVAALAKKTTTQREGLDLLEKLMIDLVSGGQWFEKSRLERLERQSKQMSDHYLPGAQVMLRRLVLLGRQADLGEEERTAHAADVIARLWATVQKGRNYLDGKLAGDEVQSEADAVMEEVLGKAWQLTELFEKGYSRKDLKVFELAYERVDDDAREERVESSHLVELSDGTVYSAITYRPFKGMQRMQSQASYVQPVAVSEAAVYPGWINRRIRWEPAAEKLLTADPKVLETVYDLAAPAFEAPLAAYRQQLKHPLAPREAVFLLRCKMVGRIGERVVVEDAKGSRIETVDKRKDYSNVANLVRAAGELRNQPALLARLWVQPVSNTIVALPLALLQPEKHLRLGL
jgi:SWIM zinc finger